LTPFLGILLGMGTHYKKGDCKKSCLSFLKTVKGSLLMVVNKGSLLKIAIKELFLKTIFLKTNRTIGFLTIILLKKKTF